MNERPGRARGTLSLASGSAGAPSLDRSLDVARLAAKVLVARYGMDGGVPVSVEALARRLKIPRLAVRRIEAEAVRFLRRLAGQGS